MPPELVGVRLARIQRLMLIIGLALVVIGAGIELVHHGHIGTHAVVLATLPSQLAAGRGAAILSLGLVALLLAPATGVAFLVAAFVRARDWLHGVIAMIVLAILIGSVLLRGLA